jgi:hypothetical protein
LWLTSSSNNPSRHIVKKCFTLFISPAGVSFVRPEIRSYSSIAIERSNKNVLLCATVRRHFRKQKAYPSYCFSEAFINRTRYLFGCSLDFKKRVFDSHQEQYSFSPPQRSNFLSSHLTSYLLVRVCFFSGVEVAEGLIWPSLHLAQNSNF